jgi:ribonuclease HII
MRRLWNFDQNFFQEEMASAGRLAGVDEAGIGPLAGPVVAAAVIVIRKFPSRELNDSKQVTPERRENLYFEILRHSLVGIGMADENEIDTLNIYHAGRLAMRRAVLALTRTPDFLLIDGRVKLDLPLQQKSIIEGDAKSASIAAASIVAKVYRDRWMNHLDGLYPGYEFRNHKGYSTKGHLEKLKEKGPSPVHRRSFEPVRLCLDGSFS